MCDLRRRVWRPSAGPRPVMWPLVRLVSTSSVQIRCFWKIVEIVERQFEGLPYVSDPSCDHLFDSPRRLAAKYGVILKSSKSSKPSKSQLSFRRSPQAARVTYRSTRFVALSLNIRFTLLVYAYISFGAPLCRSSSIFINATQFYFFKALINCFKN